MILLTSRGNREAFSGSFDQGMPVTRPTGLGGAWSYAGRRVGRDEAAGLPAFFRGVRLIADTIAGMPFRLERESLELPAPDAWQRKVLMNPDPFASRFDVWSYAIASMLLGNAYLRKLREGPRVRHLIPIDPGLVTADYTTLPPTFKVRPARGGRAEEFTSSDILHIPGILHTNPYVGISVIAAFRHTLGTQLAQQEFEGRFFTNDGTPSVVLKHPDDPGAEQRAAMRQMWDGQHAGPGRAGSTAVLWSGWDVDQMNVTLADAQFIEASNFGVQQVGRMLGIPSGMLNDPSAPGKDTPEQENMRFLQFGARPWMNRLEQGVAADRDLFPETDWLVGLDSRDLLRADIKNRFDAYRLARQGGWITANEVRGLEGYPAVDGGDVIQVTPVGGAPNPDGPGEPPDPNEP